VSDEAVTYITKRTSLKQIDVSGTSITVSPAIYTRPKSLPTLLAMFDDPKPIAGRLTQPTLALTIELPVN